MKSSALGFLACLAVACGKGSSAPPSVYRFLPADTEVAVRIDMTRARAWPQFAKVAEQALANVHDELAGLTSSCQLDVIAEATSAIVAKRGTRAAGDVTVIVGGLPRDKVNMCVQKLQAAGQVGLDLTLAVEDNLVQLKLHGSSVASAALLPSGEVVIAVRGGKGVEAAEWKAEVAGTGAGPAWASALDGKAPVAVRTADATRTVLADGTLADPFVVHAEVTSVTADAAKRDVSSLRAIATYLQQANAGTVHVEPQGTTTFVDLTAKGAQVDSLLSLTLPTLFPPPPPPPPPVDPDAPPSDCTSLGPAVKTYLEQNAAASGRKNIDATMEKLVPALQQAFISSCTNDKWAAAAIACHVQSASDITRFEKCRQMLPDDQRARFDQAVAAALAAAR